MCVFHGHHLVVFSHTHQWWQFHGCTLHMNCTTMVWRGPPLPFFKNQAATLGYVTIQSGFTALNKHPWLCVVTLYTTRVLSLAWKAEALCPS